ncbi:unnamed protein product [Vitrella brassicaformis CCMP3155]|uniref:Plastid lipid-associated protein/fibrillin conserved domain-containing protein n=2 Tax=Vitrella brassicaformis TaxID=1169539 RepID=A0A0G4EAL7_VITBC|nr:unnamed protein product [Vitrella brassicaformis CCMP3155]|mmetsp:Transcript_19296/g.46620  ORF Transcript_19296/g.46620 Transcript_19296/m.46620 type:complete len:225 (+) Transcript_19296:83-757(+)|eukprot:CEL92460.1 unnamed protein product [Vitrella brassicaformis CCMP3155]
MEPVLCVFVLVLSCISSACGYGLRTIASQASGRLDLAVRQPRRSAQSVSMILGIGKSPATATKKKDALREAIRRGLSDSEVLTAVEQVEKLNPNRRALKSPLLSGKWRLIWTTSESIKGTRRLPPFRPVKDEIFQTIDAKALTAENRETISPIPGVRITNRVEAELTPTSDSAVDVKFTYFYLGSLRIKAPDTARGALDVTYLDDEMRISRGDKGNTFVLVRAD